MPQKHHYHLKIIGTEYQEYIGPYAGRSIPRFATSAEAEAWYKKHQDRIEQAHGKSPVYVVEFCEDRRHS